MPHQEDSQRAAAAAVADSPGRPYTELRHEDHAVMTGSESAAIVALDRRLTEGLNLAHAERADLRTDIRDVRAEVRDLRRDWQEGREEDRNERRAEIAALREELVGRSQAHSEETRALREELVGRSQAHSEETRALREELVGRSQAHSEDTRTLREEMSSLESRMNARFESLEASQRELIALVSRSLERAKWQRRIVFGLGAVLLLLIGALATPVGERIVASMAGG